MYIYLKYRSRQNEQKLKLVNPDVTILFNFDKFCESNKNPKILLIVLQKGSILLFLYCVDNIYVGYIGLGLVPKSVLSQLFYHFLLHEEKDEEEYV